MKLHFFIASFLFLFYSCSDLKKGEQLESIAAMNQTIDSVQTVLIENKIDEIIQHSVEANTIETRIKESQSLDTLELNFAIKIDAYKQMIKSVEPLKKSFALLTKNTNSEKEILRKLKEDIENGNGERAKYQEFINFEQKKVSTIRKILSDYIITRKKSIETYQKYHEEIYDYAFNLLAK